MVTVMKPSKSVSEARQTLGALRETIWIALDTLRALPAAQAFDFAFIDADKTNYRHYYEEVLLRMRAGGLILIDNVLWSGAVLDPNDQTDDTRAIRAFNDFAVTDKRVELVMLPVSDGLTIARKQ